MMTEKKRPLLFNQEPSILEGTTHPAAKTDNMTEIDLDVLNTALYNDDNQIMQRTDVAYMVYRRAARAYLAMQQSKAADPVKTTTEELTIADYEEVLEDYRRLVRELDVALNGDGAAKQASLCDIVGQVKDRRWKLVQETTTEERPIGYIIGSFLDERRTEYERNGTVLYHQSMGMATTPVYALQAKTVPASVADELADALKECKFQCDEDLETIATETLQSYNKFKEQSDGQ